MLQVLMRAACGGYSCDGDSGFGGGRRVPSLCRQSDSCAHLLKGIRPHHALPRNFLFQLCKGVAHCHGHGVLHRDLKPQNLLADKEKGILKIVDLGLAEMVRRQALFPGDSELQQLLHIFRMLGTPNEEQWPGVSVLRDWHEFPQWKPQSLARFVPTLEPEGIDLLSKLLQLDQAKRISAKAAMEHPYFNILDKSQF